MRRAPIIFAAAGTAAALAGLAAYRRVVRPWYESWGVDPADENRLLPGDELVATPTAGDTRGIEIAAPAAAIWPWLVQMGLGRGGWYSYDALDMKGRSAEAIVPEWQSIAAGDTLPAWPGGGFEVAQIEPEHALVLYLDDKIVAAAERLARETAADGVGSTATTPPGLAASEAILRTQPRQFRVSWAFVLEPIDERTTRLLVRGRGRLEKPDLGAVLNFLYWRLVFEPAHFVMERKMMLGLKTRAERAYAEASRSAARAA